MPGENTRENLELERERVTGGEAIALPPHNEPLMDELSVKLRQKALAVPTSRIRPASVAVVRTMDNKIECDVLSHPNMRPNDALSINLRRALVSWSRRVNEKKNVGKVAATLKTAGTTHKFAPKIQSLDHLLHSPAKHRR